MEILDKVIFYHIEKAIKSYRQFAQNQIKNNGLTMTIDQWLVLKVIQDYPEIQLNELALKVFKDKASITRIVDLLAKHKYLTKQHHPDDGRRVILHVTKTGNIEMEKVNKVVLKNRKQALQNISQKELEVTTKTLMKITANCTE